MNLLARSTEEPASCGCPCAKPIWVSEGLESLRVSWHLKTQTRRPEKRLS